MLSLVFGLGCQSDQDRRDQHLARSETYLSEGKVKEAVIELRNALQLDPNNAEINLELARILERTERSADAYFFYGEALRLDPESGDAALGVARLGAFDETQRANEVVRELLEREPGNARAYAAKSQLALVQVDLETALADALTGVELAPEDPTVHMQLGRVHQAAIVDARRIDNREPGDDVFAAAIASFARAAELADADVKLKALHERARVFSTWPEHEEETRTAYRELLAASQETGRRDLEATAAQMATGHARSTGDTELLQAALERLIAAEPANLEARSELADLSEAEEAGSGASQLEALIEEHPDAAAVHVLYARFLATHGRRDEAVAHLEGAVDRVSEPERVLGTLTTMRFAEGDTEAAAELVDRLERDHPDAYETKFAVAQLALKEGNVEEAIERFTRLAEKSDAPEVHRLLAQAELRAGHTEKATAAIDRAIELAGEPTVALLQMKARVAYVARDWAAVLRTYRDIQATGQQTDLRAHEYMMSARAYFGLGRTRPGLAILRDLTLLEKPYVPVVVELVDRAPRRAFPFVKERLDAALEQHPGDPRVLVGYAKFEMREGNDERALARLDEALASGTDAAAIALRGQLRGRLGDHEGSIEDALLAFQVDPSRENAAALAQAYQRADRVDEAIASFEEAAAAGALPLDALPVLARLQLSQGRTDEAVASFERVLAERPDDAGVKNDLAFLLADSGEDLDRALVLAQEAQDAAPELAPVADTLGYVYLQKEMFAPAERQFRYALELDSGGAGSSEYRYHLALVLRRQGRNQEAVETLEAALAAEGDFAQADAARKELEAARAALEDVASS